MHLNKDRGRHKSPFSLDYLDLDQAENGTVCNKEREKKKRREKRLETWTRSRVSFVLSLFFFFAASPLSLSLTQVEMVVYENSTVD